MVDSSLADVEGGAPAGTWVKASRRVALAGVALAVVAIAFDLATGDLVRHSPLRNAVVFVGFVGVVLAVVGLLRREPVRHVLGAVVLNSLGYVTLLVLLALVFIVLALASPPCAEC